MAIKIHINREFLKKAAVWLLSAAIVVLTPIILLDYNIESALLHPEPYKQIIADQKTYRNLSDLIAGQTLQQLHAPENEASPPGYLNITPSSAQLLMNLDQTELTELISMLLPPEWAQIKLENLLDQYFSSMGTRNYRPTLLVAMGDIKERLQGDIGLTLFVTLIRAQPTCSDKELIAWQNSELEDVPACFPSETILKDSEPKTRELLYQISARMPDDASLEYFFGPFGFDQTEPTAFTSLQVQAARFWNSRALIRISPAFLLIMLFLLGLFHKPGQTFTKLWSIPVVLAGIVSLLMSYLIWPATNLSIHSNLIPNLPAYVSPALIETGASIAEAAIARITPFMTVQAILIILLGGLLYFADHIRQRRLRFRKPGTKRYTLL